MIASLLPALCPGHAMKVRADKLLVERGLAPSREKAQALILAGLVYLGEIRVEKPGHLLRPGRRAIGPR